MTTVHHRCAAVTGLRLFDLVVGPTGAPAVVLLHGFPASWFVFHRWSPL